DSPRSTPRPSAWRSSRERSRGPGRRRWRTREASRPSWAPLPFERLHALIEPGALIRRLALPRIHDLDVFEVVVRPLARAVAVALDLPLVVAELLLDLGEGLRQLGRLPLHLRLDRRDLAVDLRVEHEQLILRRGRNAAHHVVELPALDLVEPTVGGVGREVEWRHRRRADRDDEGEREPAGADPDGKVRASRSVKFPREGIEARLCVSAERLDALTRFLALPAHA